MEQGPTVAFGVLVILFLDLVASYLDLFVKILKDYRLLICVLFCVCSTKRFSFISTSITYLKSLDHGRVKVLEEKILS